MGPGVLWVAALLASLLSLPRLFAADLRRRHARADRAVALSAAGARLRQDPRALADDRACRSSCSRRCSGCSTRSTAKRWPCSPRRCCIGTPILSLLGAIGAALTLGLRAGGSLLALLILPLYVPVLIFGAGAVDAVRAGLGASRASVAARRGTADRAASARRSRPRPPCASRSTERRSGIAWRSLVQVLSPATFYPLAGTMIPWFAWAAALLAAIGPVHRLRRRADRFPAGRRLPDHLHPRARGVDVDVPLRRDGGLERARRSASTRGCRR